MGNSRDSSIGDIQGLIQAYIDQTGGYSRPSVPGLERGDLDRLTQQYFNQGSSNLSSQALRTAGQEGQWAGGAAASMGSNPYALVSRSKNRAYDAFTPQFGQLELGRAGQMMQNPQTAFNSQLQSKQFDWSQLAQLLGMKTGLAPQRSGGVGEWLPGLMQAGATIGGAALTGGASLPFTAMLSGAGGYSPRGNPMDMPKPNTSYEDWLRRQREGG